MKSSKHIHRFAQPNKQTKLQIDIFSNDLITYFKICATVDWNLTTSSPVMFYIQHISTKVKNKKNLKRLLWIKYDPMGPCKKI